VIGVGEEPEVQAGLAGERRLRVAAERVVDAGKYPAADDEQSRAYASQLRGLERELRGEPQPSGLSWMSVS
jgi:hypothetical protein